MTKPNSSGPCFRVAALLAASLLLTACAGSTPLVCRWTTDAHVCSSHDYINCQEPVNICEKTLGGSYLVLLDNLDGTTGAVSVKGEKGEQKIDRAKVGVGTDAAEPPIPVSDEQIRRDFGAAMDAQPIPPDRFILYFQADDRTLTPESEATMPRLLAAIAGRKFADVSIVGHTDTVGSAIVNEAVGLRLAQAADVIVRNHGARPYRLSIESQGEYVLLVPTPDETPEPRNRRAEVSVR